MSDRLHHVAVGTADVERLARFYACVFDLREAARHYDELGRLRSIWLELAGPLLMIERTEAITPRVEGVGAGFFLVAFAVSFDERRDIEQRLETSGYPIEARTVYTSYARDADGNRIAFSHYPRLAEPTDG